MKVNDPIPELKEDVYFIRGRTKGSDEWLYLVDSNRSVIKWSPMYYRARMIPSGHMVKASFETLRERRECKNMVLQLCCVTIVEMEILETKET